LENHVERVTEGGVIVDDGPRSRQRLSKAELHELRQLAKTPLGQRAIRREIWRLIQLVWLRARRILFEIWHSPRVALEKPDDARGFSSRT
jgi:hypothetical protein